MADDNKDLKVTLSVVLSEFKKGLTQGSSLLRDFARKADAAVSGTSWGRKILGTLKPVTAAISVALGGIASIALVVGRVLFSIVSIVTNVVASVLRIVWSLVQTILSLVWSLVKMIGSIVGKVLETVLGFLAKIPKALLLLGGAAAAAAVGLFWLVNRVAQTGDVLAKMSIRTGLGVRMLSELKYVLDLVGASIEDIPVAFRALSNAVQIASPAFKTLGVSIKNQRGQLKGSEQLFWEVVAALHKVPSEMERMALAQDLLGRGAIALVPLLAASAGEIQNMREQARRFGLTWSPEQAVAAERFQDALTAVKGAFSGLVKALAVPLLAPLAQQLERLAEWLASNLPLVRTFGEWLAQAFAVALVWAERAYPKVKGFIDDNLPRAKEALGWVLSRVQDAWDLGQRAWAWLESRDWGAVWANLKNVPSILWEDVLAKAPSVLGKVVEIVKLYALEAVNLIWAEFGLRAMEWVQSIFSLVSAALNQAVRDLAERRKAERIAEVPKLVGNERYRRVLAQQAPTDFLTATDLVKTRVMGLVADAFSFGGRQTIIAGEDTKQAAGRAAEYAAQRQVAEKAFADQLAGMGAKLGEDVSNVFISKFDSHFKGLPPWTTEVAPGVFKEAPRPAAATGVTVNVNINGQVLDERLLHQQIIPALQRAIQLGLFALGRH